MILKGPQVYQITIEQNFSFWKYISLYCFCKILKMFDPKFTEGVFIVLGGGGFYFILLLMGVYLGNKVYIFTKPNTITGCSSGGLSTIKVTVSCLPAPQRYVRSDLFRFQLLVNSNPCFFFFTSFNQICR